MFDLIGCYRLTAVWGTNLTAHTRSRDLSHGAQKVFGCFGGYGFKGTMKYFSGSGIPAVLAFLAITAEFLGSLGLPSD